MQSETKGLENKVTIIEEVNTKPSFLINPKNVNIFLSKLSREWKREKKLIATRFWMRKQT